MPGNTQDGLRQCRSMSGLLQAMRYMFAVGPPRSETTPVKPGTLSRISSISRMIEQKVQPPKQPRMMFTEKRIIS
ncbi:Uncharacterised protein [Klebsiella pneumoniae]|nr:Uncharacterised protein [Klebsiella pneumoniae]